MARKVTAPAQRRDGLRAIRMSAARLYIIALLLAIGCRSGNCATPEHVGQEEPAASVDKASEQGELDKQLNIYKTTLLEGKTEQIRIDAASVMLYSENPLAREALLDVLKQADNPAARAAVCKALNQTRAAHRPLKNSEDFIQPLVKLLATEEDFARAKLAAEATLVFRYEQVQGHLEKTASDNSLPPRVRLNAIYALQLHPDLKAILKLMALLDDSEGAVAEASQKALRSLGIQASRDAESRRQMMSDLQHLGPDAFLRDRIIREETEIRRLETQLSLWQARYLAVLNEVYDSKSDEAARSELLAQHLAGAETVVRLWALDKLADMRKGTDKPKLSGQIETILLDLISDQNRDVRLKTASLLSLMWELNSAERLLEQLKVEQDDQIRMELFVALGGACYFASLPTSGVKISTDLRKQTLEWAVAYLTEQDSEKARAGADVIRKLLEQNGLAADEVNKYLGLLVTKYAQQKGKAGVTLRGELLNSMAGLCAQRSVYRAQAASLFRPLFEDALGDEADLVRQAAVEGLVNIDKTNALKRLRTSFVNDASLVIRKRLVELTGEIGGAEDLSWLAEKIGTAGEGEPAWQAMLKIFGRSDAGALYKWVEQLDIEGAEGKLSDEQRMALLQVAEQKAVGENKAEVRDTIRRRLASLCRRRNEFQQAAEYLVLLRDAAVTRQQKEQCLSDLLDVYLRWPKVALATKLVENALREEDLGPDSLLVRSIDAYLAKPPEGTDPNSLLKALSEIQVKAPEDRPAWVRQLKRWSEAFAKVAEPGGADKRQ